MIIRAASDARNTAALAVSVVWGDTLSIVCWASAGFAQTQQHIAQAIIINGQQVQGVTVVENGSIRSFNCASPQPYVSADQSSSGWA